MSSDSTSSEEPDSPKAAPASPDYLPGPEEPEQAPLSPDYVPGPEYPEYLDLSDEEDSEDGPVDYPADRGDSDDDDSSDNEEEEEASDEEDGHLAPADSVVAPVVDHVPSSEETEPFETDESATPPPSPPAYSTTTRISIRPEAPMPFPSEEEVERLLALPPPPSPLISLSPPSAEERLARCLAAPALPLSPLPIVPHLYGSPNHMRAPLGFKAATVPTSLPLPSSPLPPLPSLLFIPPLVDRREDVPEAELPPRKRLCLTALTSRCQRHWVPIVASTANNMPPRRSSATARAVAAAAAAATPMTAAAVEQLIEARVSAALANHETLRNSTNVQGDGSHNSNNGIRGTIRTPCECTYKDFINCKPLSFKGTEGVVVLSQWFEKMESVFHISNCAVENQVKFATCTFLGNALTWWNSHMKTVTQDVAYAMDWKALNVTPPKMCCSGNVSEGVTS
ncbi:hypothetical protein Tco_1266423 [Tanacetum coccineum]